MQILHIAPHLGGGVGRFLFNTFKNDSVFEHSFLLLENPIEKELLHQAGLPWTVYDRDSQYLEGFLERFDIIQFEYWNHPQLYSFLANQRIFKRSRLAFYSHMLGLHPPAVILPAILDFTDIFIISTPAAWNSPAIKSHGSKVYLIHELGGCERTEKVMPQMHQGFNIAYIGTASYLKLHPQYISLCARIIGSLKEARFFFFTNDDQSKIREDANKANVSDYFVFQERIANICEPLSITDIFGYPLNPKHYGTGEQALIEAMGAGVPPVVLDNPSERNLIKDGVTGIIAKTTVEYAQAMVFLRNHPDFRKKLSTKARQYAITEFSHRQTLSRFHAVYKRLATFPRVDHRFFGASELRKGYIGTDLFLLSQGEERDMFKLALGRGPNSDYWKWRVSLKTEHLFPSKGTLQHYLKLYPNDRGLQDLLGLIQGNERDQVANTDVHSS